MKIHFEDFNDHIRISAADNIFKNQYNFNQII